MSALNNDFEPIRFVPRDSEIAIAVPPTNLMYAVPEYGEDTSFSADWSLIRHPEIADSSSPASMYYTEGHDEPTSFTHKPILAGKMGGVRFKVGVHEEGLGNSLSFVASSVVPEATGGTSVLDTYGPEIYTAKLATVALFAAYRPNSNICVATKLEPLGSSTDIGEAPKPLPPKEKALIAGFADSLLQVSLQDILHLLPERRVPRNLGNYQLVPIRANFDIERTSVSPAYSVAIPMGIATNYRKDGGKPYLDASLGIGLVFKNTLAAVAAARVDDEGRLQIVQIQDVTAKDPTDPKQRLKSGLHGGFYWRDTLVQAWMKIALTHGIGTVEIQSAQNSRWMSDARKAQLEAGYDHVAQRMGFVTNPDTKNWSMTLASPSNINKKAPA